MQPTPANQNSTGPFGLSWGVVLLICVIWVLSPIDPVPEVPLGCIGLLDDLGIAGFGVYSLVQMLSGGPKVPSAPVGYYAPPPYAQHAGNPRIEPPPGPRTVTVQPIVSTSVPSSRPAAPMAEFVVLVSGDDGQEQRIEIEATDASHARSQVEALGADGTIGRIYLKRVLSVRGNAGTTGA